MVQGFQEVDINLTYVPAFFAARTPEGASSKTRMLAGSTGPPCPHA